MRNVIILTVALEDNDKPLWDGKVVATFTLTAAHTNTQDATLADGKGGEVLVGPGEQYCFERVNLGDLLARSKAGEKMYVVGHTVDV